MEWTMHTTKWADSFFLLCTGSRFSFSPWIFSIRFHPRVTCVALRKNALFLLPIHTLGVRNSYSQYSMLLLFSYWCWQQIFVHRILSFLVHSLSLSLSSPGLHFQYAVSFVSRVLFSSDLKNYAVFISMWCFLRLLLFSSLALCKLTFSSVDSVMVRFLCKYLRMLTKFVFERVWFFSVSATFPHRCCCAWIFFSLGCFLSFMLTACYSNTFLNSSLYV